MKMNNQIVKKLILPVEKVPSYIYEFCPPHTVSIPLQITTEGQVRKQFNKVHLLRVWCWSLMWGTVAFETNGIVIPDIVEVKDSEADEEFKV